MLELAVRARRDAETAFLFPLHLLPNDIAYTATGLPSLPEAGIMNEQCVLLRVSTSPLGGSSLQARDVLYCLLYICASSSHCLVNDVFYVSYNGAEISGWIIKAKRTCTMTSVPWIGVYISFLCYCCGKTSQAVGLWDKRDHSFTSHSGKKKALYQPPPRRPFIFTLTVVTCSVSLCEGKGDW